MADSIKKKAYESPYSQQIQQLLNEVTNRPDFSYDMNADPLYQQYKDQYTRQGKQAMKDTVGNAASLTGGYASSAATTAGSQAYQGYLDQLNDRIPELYAAAYQQYQDKGNQLYNQLGLLQGLDESLYGRYRDDVADNQWQASFDYQKDRDKVADSQWQTSFDYQKDRDAISDSQWQQSFDYQQGRDKIADEQWQKNYDYQVGRDAVADEQWNKTFDYQKTRDYVTDTQWQKEFDAALEKVGTDSSGLSESQVTKISDAAVSALKKNGEDGLLDYLEYQVNLGMLTNSEAYEIGNAVLKYTGYSTTLDELAGGDDSGTSKSASHSTGASSASASSSGNGEYSSWPNGITSESDFWKAQRAGWPSVRPYATYSEYVKATKK